jgi:hypothetical protein
MTNRLVPIEPVTARLIRPIVKPDPQSGSSRPGPQVPGRLTAHPLQVPWCTAATRLEHGRHPAGTRPPPGWNTAATRLKHG